VTYAEYMKKMRISEGSVEDWLPFHEVYATITEPVVKKMIPRKTYRLKPVTFALVSGKFDKQASFKNHFLSALSIRLGDEFETEKFKEKLGITWDSYPSFLSFCSEANVKPADYISKLMSKFERNKTTSMKCLSPCFTTKSLNDTLNSMVKLSSSYDHIVQLEQSYDVRYKVHDLLRLTDLVVLEQLGWAKVTDEDVKLMKSLLSDTSFVGKMTRKYEKSLTMLAFRSLHVREAHSFCMRNGILVMWYIQKQKKINNQWQGDLIMGVSGRGCNLMVVEENGNRFVQLKQVNTRTLFGVLKSACQELNWDLSELTYEKQYIDHGDLYRMGSTFRECVSGFKAMTPVLNFRRIPFTLTPIREGWFSVKVNEKGQYELKTDDIVYLNYSVKFNMSILNNQENLLTRSRSDIVKLIRKSKESAHGGISESDDYEKEEFDFDAFMEDVYRADESDFREFTQLLEKPEEVFEDEGFAEFDISDFFESFSEEPKKYHTEMLRELRNWLYKDCIEDDPTVIAKETCLRKLQWLYNKQNSGECLDEFSEFMVEEYCSRIGISKDTLWTKFVEIETESIPVALLSHKTYVKANRILRLIKDT